MLGGWTDHPRLAKKNAKGFTSIWDFTPPPGSGVRIIRLTFLNDKLVVWD